MKILLDENLDWRLRRDLPDHIVESVPLIGWAGLKNGELISRAEGRFDVLITMDVGFLHRQDFASMKIAMLVLRARSNRLADTQPLMARVLSVLETVKPGTVTTI